MNNDDTSVKKPDSVAILGVGWLGRALFKLLVGDGSYRVHGSSRRAERRAELEAFASEAPMLFGDPANTDLYDISKAKRAKAHRLFAVSVPEITEADRPFFRVDTLVITLPPGRGRPDLVTAYRREVDAILAAARIGGVGHLIYTSTTGVYGKAKGLVQEDHPLRPERDSGLASVEAERTLAASGIPTTILRLGGLYGPDRHPGRWWTGRTSIPDSEAPVNLVHQIDAAMAIERAIEHGPPEKTAIYNVCAAARLSKADFYGRAITHYGGQLPRMEPGGCDGKRIHSSKIRWELGWSPFDDGLELLPE